MIDCSHGNSQKDHRKQADVAASRLPNRSRPARGTSVGAMLESHLVEGRQDYVPGRAGRLRPEHHRRLPLARADRAAARAAREGAEGARDRSGLKNPHVRVGVVRPSPRTPASRCGPGRARPSSMNSGTWISRPVSSVAALVTLPLAVLPRTPGSVRATVSSTMAGNCRPIGLPLYFCTAHQHVVDEEQAVVAEHVGAERQRLERVLVHEVVAVAVVVLVARRHLDEVGLLELLAGLERPVEHGPRQQVAHLEAHERLPAARGRLRDVHVEAVVRARPRTRSTSSA